MSILGRCLVLGVIFAVIAAAGSPDAQGKVSSMRRPSSARAQRLHAMLIQGVKFSASWSLEQAEKVKEFFFARFGRSLPVSAMGQTATHDKMKFDHREAMDVALHPDSKEGRALIGYLRQAKIPFIAFRRKIAGLATAAHIHIGNPSPKLEASGEAGEDSSPAPNDSSAPESLPD